ncbi:MAG: hypothetical protein CMM58_05065 [Rhodospirillaceae bacterium]|nr:hypothetical protein [Rhodospirillaceae bacterium]|tara:strand:+ start:841 stop:1131 length:291 start_codon:yes stop_codon:yes gene_type:complete
MAKGYWISAHRTQADPNKHAAYVKLAVPAIEKAGGKFLIKGGDVTAKENGLTERTVVIEFPSYEDAQLAYESADYKLALKELEGGSDRDLRIVKGT